jgi:hypothetical protein
MLFATKKLSIISSLLEITLFMRKMLILTQGCLFSQSRQLTHLPSCIHRENINLGSNTLIYSKILRKQTDRMVFSHREDIYTHGF